MSETLTISVPRARRLKGSKPDKLTSSLRLTLDSHTSDSAQCEGITPEYGYTYIYTGTREEVTHLLLNAVISITISEHLPRDKTVSIASGAIPIFACFKPGEKTHSGTHALGFSNAKLAATEQYEPNVELVMETSCDITDANETLVTLHAEKIMGIPDEWTSKEANEKDLNSALYAYTLSYSIPTVNGTPHIIQGSLYDPEVTKATSSMMRSSHASINTETSTSAPQPVQKYVVFPPYRALLPPTSIEKMKAMVQRKIGLQAEFTRTLLPKYVHLEGAASKAKGLVSIDWTSLVVPKVTELKGTYHFSTFDLGAPSGVAAEAPVAAMLDQSLLKNKITPKVSTTATSNTVLAFSMTLSAPIVAERQELVPQKKVSDYIPAVIGTPHNDEENENFRKLMLAFENEVLGLCDKEPSEEAIWEQLKQSGKMAAWKGRIDFAVKEIARKRFSKEFPFRDARQLHMITAKLFLHLNTMRAAAPAPPPVDAMNLIHLAEQYNDHKYAMDAFSAGAVWEYSAWCYRHDRTERGNEVVREGIEQSSDAETLCLITYAVHATVENKVEEAVIFFDTAIPNTPMAALLKAFMYEHTNCQVDAETAFTELAESMRLAEKNEADLYFEAADFLLYIHAFDMLDLVLAHNLRISPTLTNRIYILSARAAIAQGKYDLARDRLKEAGEGLEMDIWRGHVAFYQGEHQNAIETFEGLLETIIRDAPGGVPDLTLLHYQLAEACVHLGTPESLRKAKLYYLKTLDLIQDTNHKPFPFTWISVIPNKATVLHKIGGICLLLDELAESELALTAANNLDPRSGEIWLKLCEVCLRTKRDYEANMAIRRAVKCGFAKLDTNALLNLKTLYTHAQDTEAVRLIEDLLTSPSSSSITDIWATEQRPEAHTYLMTTKAITNRA